MNPADAEVDAEAFAAELAGVLEEIRLIKPAHAWKRMARSA